MANRITIERIQKAYEQSKLVYFEQKSLSKARDTLENAGLNKNSAVDLIANFRRMMNGQKYTRTNNTETTQYYLDNILKDFGENKLSNALSALEQHINYYENKQKTTMHSLREILENFKLSNNFETEIIYPDEVDDKLSEGKKKVVSVNAYERNPKARKMCLEHHGYNCSVCKINFEDIYGVVGKNFIHVHHLNQISEIKQEYNIDPLKDLTPVCPNCHAMLHKRNPPYTIEEMQEIINT